MPTDHHGFSRRQLLAGTAGGAAFLAMPAIVRAQAQRSRSRCCCRARAIWRRPGRAAIAARWSRRRCWPISATGSSSCISTSSPIRDVARTQSERAINDGAQCIVGAFDSACTLAMAQVCEQRQVPLVVNIAAAPQLTEQGYKFLVRNFPTGGMLVTNGLKLIKDAARRHQARAQDRGVPARQRHLRHRAAPGHGQAVPERRPAVPAARIDRLRSEGAGPVGRGHQDPRRSIPTCCWW